VPSRSVRVAVYVFLAVFVVFGFSSIEAWPFSSFKLFSQVRDAERVIWSVEVTTTDGEGIPVRMGDLPLGYGNSILRAGHFDEYTPSERDEICRAWAAALVDDEVDVRSVSVFRTVDDVRDRAQERSREPVHRCEVGR
jgi:hypothetical protein